MANPEPRGGLHALSTASSLGGKGVPGEWGWKWGKRECPAPLLPAAAPKAKKGKNFTQAVLPGGSWSACPPQVWGSQCREYMGRQRGGREVPW